MPKYITRHQLQVSPLLDALLEHEICPDIGLQANDFWAAFAEVLNQMGDENRALLDKRNQLQAQIDTWCARHGSDFSQADYQSFLRDIGYLVPEGDDFAIRTTKVDAEIAITAGPQLVVPVNNARFALNAANARWGSLYDALYGTDVIDETNGCERTAGLNPVRGKAVIAWVNNFLDHAIPLADGLHQEVKHYQLNTQTQPVTLEVQLQNGRSTQLKNTSQLVGFANQDDTLVLLFVHNSLHIELHINSTHPIGALSQASIKDVVLESALTTIMDCEDSVAAVDAEDKALVYCNWLGLMKGTLTANFNKDGKQVVRNMNPDRQYMNTQGEPLVLHGRSLLFVRNVGHLMTTDAVLDAQGRQVPEGILDAMFTIACAMHDLQNKGQHANSRTGSVYIVKPKMHGPEEVAFASSLFAAVERVFKLAHNTIKIGIMDEERRTSANLKECIRAASERVVFINTGFLDRTGDEIHTSMYAAAMLPKDTIKKQDWISAYEERNVAIGLACGLSGKAQIGKGMWPMPDEMKQMLASKSAHPLAGANCAWVPSPTAATLHAIHYHQVDVFARQAELAHHKPSGLDALLTPPFLQETLDAQTIQQELDNNAQGILGYVVRWVDQGVGCSKVPDIHNVGLMEDRATLRISSQHITNWLQHGVCSAEQVTETLERMAQVVDAQNAHDPAYQPIAGNFATSVAFAAASDLVFKGTKQPNGYTEPLLHAYRLKAKKMT